VTSPQHVYGVRPRKDHRGVDLISDALPSGRLWHGEPNSVAYAIGDAKFFSRSQSRLFARWNPRLRRPAIFFSLLKFDIARLRRKR
jgi:hypothetical protein